MIIFSIFNCIVFLILSGLHFYWALGGSMGFGEALPQNTSGDRVLNPTRFHSTVVGLGLLLFSFFYFVRLEWIPVYPQPLILAIIGWAITLIFTLRAIGDFRYVGFFKKVKDTDFARQDSRYYSPLCLVLAFNGAMVEIAALSI
jgi:MFS superfamily sulfate permease-like transporter